MSSLVFDVEPGTGFDSATSWCTSCRRPVEASIAATTVRRTKKSREVIAGMSTEDRFSASSSAGSPAIHPAIADKYRGAAVGPLGEETSSHGRGVVGSSAEQQAVDEKMLRPTR